MVFLQSRQAAHKASAAGAESVIAERNPQAAATLKTNGTQPAIIVAYETVPVVTRQE
jgi:hypothetical protein